MHHISLFIVAQASADLFIRRLAEHNEAEMKASSLQSPAIHISDSLFAFSVIKSSLFGAHSIRTGVLSCCREPLDT
jgi:hypothetical protein